MGALEGLIVQVIAWHHYLCSISEIKKEIHSFDAAFQMWHEKNINNKHNKKLYTHTLRFWEKHFKQIKPKILSGNRRYYSKKDILYLKLIYTFNNKNNKAGFYCTLW